ncbi:hypothetical protein BU26DRAFT_604391 [Trematosphaeria pertusa]|uniref:Uncharacterized protein n=1 Tax=Trematosphaeria pertusa TaxID=390896 RepID=A0A6A6IKZ4_9PLEO|nr:uncharacterized protein BU26DRAFT_604391 [Trematosphaeria pertusa]KAF2250163.1 hypothetical protein BU26DRAFT_604391 [Trematosphaeria pertusa]
MEWASSPEGRSALADAERLRKKLNSLFFYPPTFTKGTTKQQDEDAKNAELEHYAKLSCRALCEQMWATLPRELRDAVYEDIVGPSLIHKPAFWRRKMRTLGRDAHWWNGEYVGNEVLRELAETWYRTQRFRFSLPEAIPKYLDTDEFGLGIDPTEFIAHVELVRVQKGGFQLRRSKLRRQPECFATLKRDERLAGIKCLERLKRRADIHIRMNLERFLEKKNPIADSIEEFTPLFPVLRLLQDAGCKVYAHFHAEWSWSVRCLCVGPFVEAWTKRIPGGQYTKVN